jgi:hypothetical protein
MTLTLLTNFLFYMNGAIDNGNYRDITVREVEGQIEALNLLPWLEHRLGDAVDLGAFRDAEERADLNSKLLDVLGGVKGRERRKFGIRNSGLCLLIALTAELIQRRAWEEPKGGGR